MPCGVGGGERIVFSLYVLSCYRANDLTPRVLRGNITESKPPKTRAAPAATGGGWVSFRGLFLWGYACDFLFNHN